MKLTPELEAQGLRAYEAAGAFEQLRRRRWPLIYCGLLMMWLMFTLVAIRVEHPGLCAANLLGIGVIAFVSWRHWMGLKEQYGKNLQLLAKLERSYGDQLPWVRVENHFAALEKLKRELAEEKWREGD